MGVAVEPRVVVAFPVLDAPPADEIEFGFGCLPEVALDFRVRCSGGDAWRRSTIVPAVLAACGLDSFLETRIVFHVNDLPLSDGMDPFHGLVRFDRVERGHDG